jgi:hypothetical protein
MAGSYGYGSSIDSYGYYKCDGDGDGMVMVMVL